MLRYVAKDKTRCVQVTLHAHITDSATDLWKCDEGYEEKGSSCVKKESTGTAQRVVKSENGSVGGQKSDTSSGFIPLAIVISVFGYFINKYKNRKFFRLWLSSQTPVGWGSLWRWPLCEHGR